MLIMVGLPLCALIAISVISFQNFGNLQNEIHNTNALHLDRATMINGDRDAYQAQRALEIATNTDSIEIFKQQKADVDENIQQTWDRINDPAQRFPAEMQEETDRFTANFNKWKDSSNNILELAQKTISVNQSLASSMKQALSVFGDMRETIDQITDDITAQLEDVYLASDKRIILEKAVMLVLNGDRDAYQAYVGLLLASRTDDKNVLDKQAEVFIENAGQLKDRVIKAADMAGGKSLPLKKRFLELYQTWLQAAKTVVDLSQSNFEDSHNILEGKKQSYSHFSAMRDAIDKLGDAESNRVEQSIADMNASIEQAVLFFIILSAVFILVSLSLALLISKRISNGVNKSTSAATQIAQGDFNINLQAEGKDEIAELGKALNSMANMLKANHDEIQQKSVLAEKKAAEAMEASAQAQEAMKQAETAKQDGLRTAANKLENVVKNVTASCSQLNEQSENIRNGSEIQADRITNTATQPWKK